MRHALLISTVVLLASGACAHDDDHTDSVVAGLIRDSTRISVNQEVPAANFDAAYQAANRGRIHVRTPEVYELVNIAIALTPTALADSGLVVSHTPYHAAVLEWFRDHASHDAVLMLDSALASSLVTYFTLKMNGLAFEFDERNRIVKTRHYDRTGFPGGTSQPAGAVRR